MCVLSDHQPVNHQEFELSVIKESTVNTGKSKEHCAQPMITEFERARTQRISQDSNTVKFEKLKEHCAQPRFTEFEGARTQNISPDSNTVMFNRQNEHCAQAIISQFEDARTQKVSSEGRDTRRRHRRATYSTFRGRTELLGCRIFDHAGTTVTVHTRHDQRAIVVGVCDTTKRIMVPSRVDRRLPH